MPNANRRLIDEPPVLFDPPTTGFDAIVREALKAYGRSLPDERRVRFGHDRLEDIAVKVVGIGSVGTRCFVGFFFSARTTRCCCSSRRRAPPCASRTD